MVVLVIVLAIVAVVAVVLAVVWRAGITAQRRLTAAADAATTSTADERDAATARATAAEEQAAQAEAQATDAAARAADAEARAAEAEAQAASAAARNGIDPDVLWALEQARSERTWRNSVAVSTEGSFLDGAEDPLVAALQVDLDAAREEVGAVVELEADVPALTPAGSVLVLRAAQELVARAVKVAEETTLRVAVDGNDVVVTVAAHDEDGELVALEPLAVPESADLVAADGGVRILRAVVPLGSPG